ncbi:acetylcholinesterase-like isoform X2 [Ornithodoros turicata]|uniref:acetylcholinesterase-like isoform X2 n=1 Tax=Ornithodoros turicata TaxID=34597 RepID=UPI0031395C35
MDKSTRPTVSPSETKPSTSASGKDTAPKDKGGAQVQEPYSKALPVPGNGAGGQPEKKVKHRKKRKKKKHEDKNVGTGPSLEAQVLQRSPARSQLPNVTKEHKGVGTGDSLEAEALPFSSQRREKAQPSESVAATSQRPQKSKPESTSPAESSQPEKPPSDVPSLEALFAPPSAGSASADKAGKESKNERKQSDRKSGKKKAVTHWFHKLQTREVVVKIALGLTATISIVATIMSLVWLKSNVVDVAVREYGTVRGSALQVEGKQLFEFLGIYYAASPEGMQRFKLPVATRKVTKVLDATVKRPGCMQPPVYINSETIIKNEGTMENCLHLNIWTPCLWLGEVECHKTVVVFFFGTVFQNGDNNRYDGRYFSSLGDVVLVVPNFRLGAFGFVAHEGNLALHDQQLALEWILKHIQSFGGNSSDVVLMGSGSGAWSIGAHLLSANPFWRRRFSRVIMQGESPFSRQFKGRVDELGSALQCQAKQPFELMNCIRKAPAAAILEQTVNMKNTFGPTTDRELLIDVPSNLTENHIIQDKELLVGCVSNEGSSVITNLVKNSTTSNIREALGRLLALLDVKNQTAVFSMYTNGSEKNIDWAHYMVSDIIYVCPLISFANYLSSKGNRVFGYTFEHTASFSRSEDSPGTPHLQDLDFIMGVPLQEGFPATPEERALSRAMIQIWSKFAKSGKLPSVDNSAWPTYSVNNHRHVRITLNDFKIIQKFHWKPCMDLEGLFKELEHYNIDM